MQSTSELLQTVRAIRTLDGGVPIYQSATISTQVFHPEGVAPIARYVLSPSVARLEQTYRELMESGVNLFDLDGVVEYRGFPISPPIVEYSPEDNANLIVDGIHRFYLARRLGSLVRAVYVHGADQSLPVIGLPVGWHEIVECETPPPAKERRRLRSGIEDRSEVLRRYYRDYSPLGSTGRRPSEGQNG